MINIAASQPVHWPVSSTATTVAPVAAIAAVSSAPRSQREGQPGLGSDRSAYSAPDSRMLKGKASDKTPEAPQAAPILPREKPKDGEEPAAAEAKEGVRKAAQDAQTDEDERAEQKLKLLDVLSSVWRASAAVVDNALGLSEETTLGTELGPKAGQTRSLAASKPPESGDLEPTMRADGPSLAKAGETALAQEPPVAYTEQGASEWGALEMGRLVSKLA